MGMPTRTPTPRTLLQSGLMLCLFLLPAAAMAQGMIFPSGMQERIASISVSIIAGLHLLSWVFFVYLTILLDPEFIFNTQEGDGFITVLNNIWILSRDLMNIVFALALIGAAIYTIITAKKDFVATHLKTFVMAVILVNFSWFIPRVIIDIGNVAAAAIYGVPSLLQNQGVAQECRFTSSRAVNNISCTEIPANDPESPPHYSCQCALLANAKFFLNDKEYADLNKDEWECSLGKTMCLYFVDLDSNAVTAHSTVLNGLIVNHARLQSLAGVAPVENSSQVNAIIKFLLQQMIVLVIHIALFFPLAAMVAAFAIRIPILWITIAFMPFALLKFVVPDQYTGGYPQKLWDWFLQAAFLPAIVAIPLSIGFILVNAGSQLVNSATVVGRINIIPFHVADGVSDLFELLWLGITLGVLYAGVFSVLRRVEFAAPASEFINSIGRNLGAIALKLPLSLPVIPGPGGRGISPLQFVNPLNTLRSFNYNLSNNPGGLPAVLKSMQAGTGGAPFQMAQAAEQFRDAQTNKSLDELNTKIGNLTARIRQNGSADPQFFERFAQEVRNMKLKAEIPIDAKNPQASLEEFLEKLRRVRPVNDPTVNTLNTNIGQLRDAIKNTTPQQPPPATPPGTTP